MSQLNIVNCQQKCVLFGFLNNVTFFIYLFVILVNENFTGKKSANHLTDFFNQNIVIAIKLKNGYLII